MLQYPGIIGRICHRSQISRIWFNYIIDVNVCSNEYFFTFLTSPFTSPGAICLIKHPLPNILSLWCKVRN